MAADAFGFLYGLYLGAFTPGVSTAVYTCLCNTDRVTKQAHSSARLRCNPEATGTVLCSQGALPNIRPPRWTSDRSLIDFGQPFDQSERIKLILLLTQSNAVKIRSKVSDAFSKL